MLRDQILQTVRDYPSEILVGSLAAAALWKSVGLTKSAPAFLLFTVWVLMATVYAMRETSDRTEAKTTRTDNLLQDDPPPLRPTTVASESYPLSRRPARALVYLRANPALMDVLPGVPTNERPIVALFLDRFQELYGALLTRSSDPTMAVPLLMDVRDAVLERLYAYDGFGKKDNQGARQAVGRFGNVSFRMLETARRFCRKVHPTYCFPGIETKSADRPFDAHHMRRLP